jgi:leader peptidase (prepilin peptidase)/N-methyltransferase
MKTAIPFGPFLSMGALLYVLWGQEIWDLYLGLFA